MSIFQHFRAEEKPFIEKLLEWISIVERREIAKLTDFLDPRQAEILQTLVNRNDRIHVTFYGGYDEAERVRGLILPEYLNASDEEFRLSVVKIESTSSFHTLEHRDYLGALLNIGIIREKFGDLIVHPSDAQLFIVDEMKDFVRMQLTHVGKAPVRVTEIPIQDVKLPVILMEEKRITVPSKRLDAIVSEITHLSRTKAVPLISSGKIKVNWRVADTPSLELKVGDVLSVRGYGRFTFLEENGVTKKGNLLLTIGFRKET